MLFLLHMISMHNFLDSEIDGAVIMLAVAVFVTSSPPQLVTDNTSLLRRICNLFKRCLENEHKQVIFHSLDFVVQVNSIFLVFAFSLKGVCFLYLSVASGIV